MQNQKRNCRRTFASWSSPHAIQSGRNGPRIFKRRRSAPGGLCNSRRKGKRYATRPCCRTGCTCSTAAPASDATPCGCAGASSKFCVWELPYERSRKAGIRENTNPVAAVCDRRSLRAARSAVTDRRYSHSFSLSNALQSGVRLLSAADGVVSGSAAGHFRPPSRSQCGCAGRFNKMSSRT